MGADEFSNPISRQYTSGSAPSSRVAKKATQQNIKAVMREVEGVIGGPVERLLSSQTGVDGFTLGSLLTQSGTLSGTAVCIPFTDKDGTTLYLYGYPTKS